jgi:putative membrane protein
MNEDLRDSLAQERTQLAHERTVLAYWRTALAFLVLGGALLEYFQSTWILILAALSLVFGASLFFYGTHKFMNRKKKNR